MSQLTIQQAFEIALQHQRAGRLRQAGQLYRQILDRQGGHVDTLHNLGVVSHLMGENDLAIEYTRKAIELSPDSADSYGNLGNALKNNGQIDEAIAMYRQALRLRPDFADIHSNLIYTLYFHPQSNPKEIADEHRRWSAQHAEPLKRFIRPHVNDRNPDRRLRIGYVSPDFREHCQAFFTLPLLEAHDHEQVEVFCYSDLARPDPVTKRLQGHADVWRGVADLTDEDRCALIRQDRIDILVDLTMHMGNRLALFCRKPAPVQVCWLAYPGGTGLSTMDYRLSDPYLDPPDADGSVYVEKTIRLPDSFWCYDPLDGRTVPHNPLPADQNKCITFGNLNNYCKVNPGVFSAWAKVLKRVERSRLLMLAQPGYQRGRVLHGFSQNGIDPARIEFVARQPRPGYLKTYHRIDVGLDAFPYNGHSTSLDAYWMGVPVVTLVGPSPVARAGWCQLSNLGLPELAAKTEQQFVEIAVELATNLPRLRKLRQTLRQRMIESPLMNAPRFARGMEAAYRRMWSDWCRQSPSGVGTSAARG